MGISSFRWVNWWLSEQDYNWPSNGCSEPNIILTNHYNDVIMNVMASQVTSFTIVYPTVCSRRKSKKTPKLLVTRPHEGPVTRKMFPFDDVIMILTSCLLDNGHLSIPCTEWPVMRKAFPCHDVYTKCTKGMQTPEILWSKFANFHSNIFWHPFKWLKVMETVV